MFYFDTKYGENGIARLKDEETMETVRIYLPKSIKQDIELARKINKKEIVHEKLSYEGFEYSDKVKVYVGEFYSISLNSKPRLENGTRKKTLV